MDIQSERMSLSMVLNTKFGKTITIKLGFSPSLSLKEHKCLDIIAVVFEFLKKKEQLQGL